MMDETRVRAIRENHFDVSPKFHRFEHRSSSPLYGSVEKFHGEEGFPELRYMYERIRVGTHSATWSPTYQPVRAVTENFQDAPSEIAGHKAIDRRIQCAVRVSEKQAIGEGIHRRFSLCEQFHDFIFRRDPVFLGNPVTK